MDMEFTDEQILEGLKQHDEAITRQYFYGYCRLAYYLCDRRYDLTYKTGMDFYSIAHEYYLALDKHQWRQMEDRKPGTSLRSWMIGGFRFIVLDKLKQTAAERMRLDIEQRAAERVLECLDYDSSFREDVRNTVEEVANIYYGRDTQASMILKLMLVDGYKGKEVAQMLGVSPSAITQRYHKMMRDVVVPYFRRNYEPEVAQFVLGKEINAYQFQFEERTDERRHASSPMPSSDIRFRLYKPIFPDFAKGRTTPEELTSLQEGEIFVFGSNLSGMHGGGTARVAFLNFGAIIGQGVGLQGRSYAIPTMQGGTDTIRPYVDEFIRFARRHSQLRFLVTRIGCGLAGFSPAQIAPLFREVKDMDNIYLPADFWRELAERYLL